MSAWLVSLLGAAWSAVATATSGGELQFPSELQASAGEHTLTIEQVPFGGYSFKTRGYNGGVPGPTLRVSAGETIQIQLVNNLKVANNLACAQASGNFCEIGVTNLHVHGLHVSSKGKEDGLDYYGDDIFAEVRPGETEHFKFALPDYHMSGTHWYHPHHHHATALQAGGGAAGAIIIEDPPGYLPAAYVQMPERILFISGHDLSMLQSMADVARSGLFQGAVASATSDSLPTNVFLVNGQHMPVMTMASHTWYRFRMIYAAVEEAMALQVTATTAGGACSLQLMAKDGVYLLTMPRAVTKIHLFPGARADVAVSCTCTSYPCEVTLGSTGGRRLQQGLLRMRVPPVANVALMKLSITETVSGVTPTLEPTSVNRPDYVGDLRGSSVPAGDQHEMGFDFDYRVKWDGQGQRMTYQAVADAGGKRNWPAMGSLTRGRVYDISIRGTHMHPVHFHINPYQIVELDGGSHGDGYFQVGDWHDTLVLIGSRERPIRVRMLTDNFTGKMVAHCHTLHHEDEGMMGWIDITATDVSHSARKCASGALVGWILSLLFLQLPARFSALAP